MEGTARAPRPGQAPGNRDSRASRARREQNPVLASVTAVNGTDPQLAAQRPEFAKLTPLHP